MVKSLCVNGKVTSVKVHNMFYFFFRFQEKQVRTGICVVRKNFEPKIYLFCGKIFPAVVRDNKILPGEDDGRDYF